MIKNCLQLLIYFDKNRNTHRYYDTIGKICVLQNDLKNVFVVTPIASLMIREGEKKPLIHASFKICHDGQK